MFGRILDDSVSNSDGWALLLILKNGKPMFVQSLDLDPIFSILMDASWERMFLHSRFTTQGESTLPNCHGWQSNGTYVFHNGILSNPQADDFPVDSQLINWWIDRYGVNRTLQLLKTEYYANVFLVDTKQNEYIMHRSQTGSLFTDGLGNYSSNPVGSLVVPVPRYSNDIFELGMRKELPKSWFQTWVDRGGDEEMDNSWSHLPQLKEG